MNAPAKPWRAMEPAEKLEAVRVHILAGTGYAKIADILGAPTKGSIASVVSRLREQGALPPAPTKRQTGAMSGAVSRIKAKSRSQADHLHARNITNKAESRKRDSELIVRRAFAFDPLPGVNPISFIQNTGCKWPVDGVKGPGLFVCGAPRDLAHAYCETHRALAYTTPPQRKNTAERAVERLA